MQRTLNRRRFVRCCAFAAAPAILPGLSLAAPPSSRLQHAAIGVAGMGNSDLSSLLRSGRIDVVALCDVDEGRLEQAAKLAPKARRYRDWRELLEREGDRIDSVNVSVPDHMHAPVAMSALRRGKHVYCQKPLTHEVHEARRLTRAAREAGVATQMGIQIHSHTAYRMAVRLIESGAIGKVKEWRSWCSAAGSGAVTARPARPDPLPPELNWEAWLGVAPFRPYNKDVYHPGRWRAWKDFGNGAIGDFGCHIFDPVVSALGLGAPLRVRAEISAEYAEVWPRWEILHYEFPGTELTAGKTIKGVWHDGGKQPPRELAELPADRKLPQSGSLFIGEEGQLLLPHWAAPELLPKARFKGFAYPKVEARDHYADWVAACLGGAKTTAGFDYAGPLTETVLLGALAARLPGQTLEWDAKKMKVTNSADATRLLRRDYRKGWAVPGLSDK